ncbi:unnamed protein product [Discosporangium mesarthrocarpum]
MCKPAKNGARCATRSPMALRRTRDGSLTLLVAALGILKALLAVLAQATGWRPSRLTGGEVPPTRLKPVRIANLPQGEEYFVNSRGKIIHIRTYFPKAEEIKGLVLFVHGYGTHINTARKQELGNAMPPQGLAMVQMDLEGHGYSGGERAYIERYMHWVEDYLQLLEIVAGGRELEEAGGGYIRASQTQRRKLRQVPFFLTGESLGGGLSLLVGLSMQEQDHPLLPRFRGEVLLAPAIKGNPPHPAVVGFLRLCIAPLVPRWQIPQFLETVNTDKCILHEEDQLVAEKDVIGHPGGLGWGGTMRFRTGLTLIDLTTELSSKLGDVRFPFLIMHDPDDGVVQFGPSEDLTRKAKTPPVSPRARELKTMDGMRHSLLSNCPEVAIEHLSEWILFHISPQ